jgi:hypothetical protein
MASITLRVLRSPSEPKPALGEFSKGTPGSVSLNFGLSAGKYCDKECAYHPANKNSDQQGRCYAIRIEQRFDRAQLLAKLVRHEQTDPAELCRQAVVEIQKLLDNNQTIPWFRFSTGGSVPKPSQCTKRFIKAFVALLDFLDSHNIPIHLPVETKKKHKFYRKFIGARAVVRRSTYDEADFVNAKHPVSFVAGHMDHTRGERVAESKRVAKRHTERTGRKTVVCPAVAASYLYWDRVNRVTNHKAKCGNCVACADPGKDIIYPLH